MQSPEDTRYETLLVKIGSPVCSVGLLKKYYVRKRPSYWHNERLYFTHMGRNPQ